MPELHIPPYHMSAKVGSIPWQQKPQASSPRASDSSEDAAKMNILFFFHGLYSSEPTVVNPIILV